MGIRQNVHLREDGDGTRMPEAFYVLTKKTKERFCKLLKDLKFPNGFAANLGRSISADGTKLQGRPKTHSCHVLRQRIIPAALRGLVREDVYHAIA
jgi:predicted NAD/FAD-binding protein